MLVAALAGPEAREADGGLFIVVGQYVRDRATGALGECFESYEKADLFEAVVRRALPRARPDQLERRFGLADLRQRVLTYFALLNTLLLLAGWGAWQLARRAGPVPEYAGPAEGGTFDLRDQLFPAGGPPPRRVVLVAASGGGTRAALYAASVFQGLSDEGALADVRLFSGVSGGSAAIAYLTIHRADLVGRKDAAAWAAYGDVMAAPFIEDVLRGAAEWRHARGSGLGALLDESFRRRMGDAGAGAPHTLGGADVGLIFNTTLAATSARAGDGWAPATPAGAGGRLLFTNVRPADAFPSRGYDDGTAEEYLIRRLVRDPAARLTTAAALSANFPPVFANALVETPQVRYWVTDGGASDNRGALSALYVLRDALRRECRARGHRPDGGRPPPPVHILVAKASGFTMDYAQDRGLGSALGAAEKYASQLMVELMHDVRDDYVALGGDRQKLHLHYLPMPLVFRERGGVGTHWMLGAFVTLTDSTPAVEEAATVTLSGETVRQLIMDLHRGPPGRGAGNSGREREALSTVRGWIARDPHQGAWDGVVRALKAD
jgi:hypothetical protein